MSKTLTEQWREGTLPAGHYYCKLYYNRFKPRIQECVKSAYSPKSCIPMSCGCEGEEVLAPVPSYDEYNKMMIKIEKMKLLLDKNIDLMEKMNFGVAEQVQKINNLQNQLNEANKLLKSLLPMDRWKDDADVIEYLKKWGVK